MLARSFLVLVAILVLACGASADSTSSSFAGPTSESSSEGSSSESSSSTAATMLPDLPSDSEGSSSSSESSTGEAAPAYAYCDVDDISACPDDDECVWSFEHDGASAAWCAAPCPEQGESGCPMPDSGTATPACVAYGDVSRCVLQCADGLACPEGMTCQEALNAPLFDDDYTWVCAWAQSAQ